MDLINFKDGIWNLAISKIVSLKRSYKSKQVSNGVNDKVIVDGKTCISTSYKRHKDLLQSGKILTMCDPVTPWYTE